MKISAQSLGVACAVTCAIGARPRQYRLHPYGPVSIAEAVPFCSVSMWIFCTIIAILQIPNIRTYLQLVGRFLPHEEG